jgi:hypothetical protein|tara:strand:- start:10570 stop:10815 length:246 start_codon:yes stop_codon:yes gene_type:complete
MGYDKSALIKIDKEWIEAIVNQHFKDLSPTQKKDVVRFIVSHDGKLYSGINQAICDCVNEWKGWQNMNKPIPPIVRKRNNV